jgi:hypothetical protein
MEINNVARFSYPVGAQSTSPNNGTVPDTAGNVSSTEAKNQPGAPASQDLSVSSNINYIQQQLNDIMEDYPPLFPAGKPQKMDWILTIRNVQDKIAKSSLPDEVKKTLSGPPITDQATDSDISTALAGLNNLKSATSQQVASAPDASQQGTIVDITV